MYYVYILRSIKTARHYIGATENLERRLTEHNFSRCRSTKAYRPWEIVYKEEFNSRLDAFNREKEIKKYKSGIKFKKLINPERWQSG